MTLKGLTVIIIFFLSLIKNSTGCDTCNKTYVAPGNIKFPYGDEYYMACDVTAHDINTVICRDLEDRIPEYSRCPYPPADPNDMKQTNPYVPCIEFSHMPGPKPIPLDAQVSSTDAVCTSCDVKVTPDGGAVNMKCIGCHELPTPEHAANGSEKELIFTVYYMEIANYTSVNVQGSENMNP
ncbi:uncharacterized protein LOC126739854 isoform X1 [Anthonomus grandis grandis]|uniref:uncharacterized protein LOC126739854 isoform X1 n=1 Tax=Anthonomus grandis grandis TaxID=2921223 RepID=UPI0021650051|nr:uncharacterized protein LOC126739854 isoform X1 [Anthonomus grandis grandis]